jgi:hypothetical protein
MQRTRDANELAARILVAALNPHVGRAGDPRRRMSAAMRYQSIEAFSHLTPERRREIGAMGARVFWEQRRAAKD